MEWEATLRKKKLLHSFSSVRYRVNRNRARRTYVVVEKGVGCYNTVAKVGVWSNYVRLRAPSFYGYGGPPTKEQKSELRPVVACRETYDSVRCVGF